MDESQTTGVPEWPSLRRPYGWKRRPPLTGLWRNLRLDTSPSTYTNGPYSPHSRVYDLRLAETGLQSFKAFSASKLFMRARPHPLLWLLFERLPDWHLRPHLRPTCRHVHRALGPCIHRRNGPNVEGGEQSTELAGRYPGPASLPRDSDADAESRVILYVLACRRIAA